MPTRFPDGERILDEIRLQELQVRCMIGIHPEEEISPQLLRLNLVLHLDTRPAALSGRLQKSVDYAALARELSFILTHARFRLLESAAEALASYVLAPAPIDKPHARIEALELEIIKPEALAGVAMPSIRIFRKREEVFLKPTAALIDGLLFAAPEAAIFSLVCAPQSELNLDFGDWQIEAALPASSGLFCNGRELQAGEHLGQVDLTTGRFANNGETPRSLLLVAHRKTRQPPRSARRPSSPSLYN